MNNMTTESDTELQIYTADSLVARTLGLIGLDDIPWNWAIHLKKASTLHTFGYRFSLDILYLDSDRCVIAIKQARKNSIITPAKGAKSIVQMKEGAVNRNKIDIGSCLGPVPEREYKPPVQSWRTFFHWPVNLLLATIYILFVNSAWQSWTETRNPISFGLVIVNTIIFYLFLTRRESKDTTPRALDWLIAAVTVLFSFLLEPEWTTSAAAALFSTIVQILGIVLVSLSLASLGKSFGIVPANRRVKTRGAFQWVRHPLYASEITFYIGYLIGNFTLQNMILVLGIIIGQLYRAHAEEALLSNDPVYLEYKKTVPYRFIPGLY